MRRLLTPRARSTSPRTRRPRLRHVSLEHLEARALLTVYPLTSVPALHSDPGAPATLFLDFDGHYEPVYGSYTDVTNPAYDVDGDATTFSDHELDNIAAIWAAVAEDYVPFNIDVTTVQPDVLAPGVPLDAANKVAQRVAIGGMPDVFEVGGGNAGISYIGCFTNSVANDSYVYPDSITTRDTPASMAADISHESGHAFGLQHQSLYNADGTKYVEYNWGDMQTWTPLMGTILRASQTSIWYNGTSSLGPTAYQDDMAVIAGATNGFGYRPDDHASTSPLSQAGDTWSGSGIIGTNTDVDTFSFTVSVENTYRIAARGLAADRNLDAVIELRDGAGRLVETSDPQDSLDAVIVRDLAPGNYTLAVKSSSRYGWIGQYTVSIDLPPPGVTVTPASNLMTTSEGGRQATFQVVLQTRPQSDVALPISSTNTAEGTVSASSLVFTPDNWNAPQTVTVTGVADGIVDDDVPYGVVVGAASSADPEYNGLDPADVALANVDIDAAGFLYRVDHATDVIERDRLDGSQPEVLVDLKSTFGTATGYSPHGIAVDAAGGKLYWTDATTHGIYRANLDGSGAEVVVSASTGNLKAITLDTAAGKMYWSDTAAHTVHRANLDGSLIEDLITDPSSNIWGIALDVGAGKIYWTDLNQDRVSRANLDGSNVEVLWTGETASSPYAIALDTAAGKMYWCDPGENVIRRANLDGTGVETVVDGTTYAADSNIYGLALDASAGKLYWSDFGTQTQTIYRSNLDGTTIVPLVSGAHTYNLTVVHPAPGVSVSPRSGLVTTEAGGSDVVQVSLATRPTADVFIPVSSGDPTEGTVSTSTLIFTPDNWNVPQTVTIAGVDDASVDGDVGYTLVLGAASSTDPAYDGLDPADVGVTNLDDDVPPEVTTTYSVAPNQSIPDRRTITSSLVIGDAGTILDLDVRVNIPHTSDADLDVYLIAPDGTRIMLFTDVGGSRDNFTSTVLDDEAATPITSGSAPFTGTFRPEGNLTALEGKNLSGTWTLEVTDDARKNTGMLLDWSITVRYAPASERAASIAAAPAGTVALTVDQAAPIVAAARDRWAATGADVSVLDGIDLQVANLPDGQLAQAFGRTLTIDDDAAGFGWFVDATPGRDAEYLRQDGLLQARPGSEAEGRMDLLSVALHELGHWLGHDHDEGGVMSEALAPGVRRLLRESRSAPDFVRPAGNDPTQGQALVILLPDQALTGLATDLLLDRTKRSRSASHG